MGEEIGIGRAKARREAVETYRELGYQVKIVNADDSDLEGCTVCMDVEPGRYKIIYTRKPREK